MSNRTASTTPSENAPARALRADAERNRQRIIAAAQEVFAERGLDVTLDDVAHHAGVGVGTVYRRFGGREELVEAVFEDEALRVVALAEQALAHEDPWDGLVEYFLAAAQRFADNRGLREVLLGHVDGRPRVAAARERLMPAVGALIARAQQDGRLRDDIERTDFPLIQIMLGAVTQHSRTITPDLWKRYLTLILDGIRRDRGGPSPLPHRALDLDEFAQTMK
ncbi:MULTISPECIES: TetR/AcrR family transcriptional regulator [unclassified Streptomyces]|uniref:TetR/AcrR family transcriptional regulator n=1 Tax=unclassified Streptomyces TaxID=2593676 RepID=UPI0003793803|nr:MULTISPECIES: TetR/AcrR family transcriptional regulator [unclassified Streptomyces]AWN30453.1 TetR/AcrR family transcriptional regulator [Streptomyces sp. NEAU-S7GS2]MCW7987467.1 TetR family transcriptional regulator [Streptomyces platensis subsp. clarensis]MYX07375.1 TetR family transcriptional regulator [Streptomyces sp. SID8375]